MEKEMHGAWEEVFASLTPDELGESNNKEESLMRDEIYLRSERLWERILEVDDHGSARILAGFFGWIQGDLDERDLRYLEKIVTKEEAGSKDRAERKKEEVAKGIEDAQEGLKAAVEGEKKIDSEELANEIIDEIISGDFVSCTHDHDQDEDGHHEWVEYSIDADGEKVIAETISKALGESK